MKRQCGDCTACCTVMGVPSISKPGYVACDKLCAKGCSVYAERPEECRDFSCVWLQDDGRVFRNMERPDHVGVMFDVSQEKSSLQALVARAVRPGAFNEPAAKKMIERLSKRVLIILLDGKVRGLAGPPHLVEKAQRIVEVVKGSAP